jgi:hypothetical protein
MCCVQETENVLKLHSITSDSQSKCSCRQIDEFVVPEMPCLCRTKQIPEKSLSAYITMAV